MFIVRLELKICSKQNIRILLRIRSAVGNGGRWGAGVGEGNGKSHLCACGMPNEVALSVCLSVRANVQT